MNTILSKKPISKKGYTLIEVVVSIFIFSLAITLIAGTFSSFMKNYSQAKRLQIGVENAQYAMNLMAKTLRTSTLFSAGFPLQTYDWSQSSCIEYNYDGTAIQRGSGINIGTPANPNCDFSATVLSDITVNDITRANLAAIPTSTASPFTLGRVTLSLGVTAGQTTVNTQMTVALRQ